MGGSVFTHAQSDDEGRLHNALLADHYLLFEMAVSKQTLMKVNASTRICKHEVVWF